MSKILPCFIVYLGAVSLFCYFGVEKEKSMLNIWSNDLRIDPLKPLEMPPTDNYKSQRSTDSRAKITLIDILFTFPFLKRNAVSIYILTSRVGWKIWSMEYAECMWKMRSMEMINFDSQNSAARTLIH